MNPNELNPTDVPQSEPRRAPWRQWGLGLEPEAVRQMANACALPVAVAGALMPDAHVGYGLPIGAGSGSSGTSGSSGGSGEAAISG
jgi:tRNA-splicing ligase RtcB (3'-phosphate/5'-hydroxy nucleic acid ligase)